MVMVKHSLVLGTDDATLHVNVTSNVSEGIGVGFRDTSGNSYPKYMVTHV